MRHELTHYLLESYNGYAPEVAVGGRRHLGAVLPRRLLAGGGSRADLYTRLMRADHTLPIIGLFNEDPSLNYPISQAAVSWLVAALRRGQAARR